MAYLEVKNGSDYGNLIDTLRVSSFTSATTIELKDELCVADVDGGSFTLTLPASPNDGERHIFRTLNRTASKKLTVDGNGKDIWIGNTTFSAVFPGDASTFVYSSTAGVWMSVNES